MIKVPLELQSQFEHKLRKSGVPERLWWQYNKWLRYYLDFCRQYTFAPEQADSLPHFLHKLQEKKQTAGHREQAASAIQLYYRVARVPGCKTSPSPAIKDPQESSKWPQRAIRSEKRILVEDQGSHGPKAGGACRQGEDLKSGSENDWRVKENFEMPGHGQSGYAPVASGVSSGRSWSEMSLPATPETGLQSAPTNLARNRRINPAAPKSAPPGKRNLQRCLTRPRFGIIPRKL